MKQFSIADKCRINTNIDTDTFVGIVCDEKGFTVNFPLGYHISEDEKELRRDILLLMNAIASTVGRRESEITEKAQSYNQVQFPFQAYLSLIYDFYGRGYYKEREVQYNISKRGKIDWNKTIKTQKMYVQDNNVFYLDFVTKKNLTNENELITLVHEYCVYDAFLKLGWLFTASLPTSPRLKYNEKLFRRVVTDKLTNTFNDKNKALFTHMLAIINYLGDKESNRNFKYGTSRFEYVWECLIDRVFGVGNKDAYYPKTTWNISGASFEVSENYENSSLRPDTIMISGGNIYIIDAKYYKYGAYPYPGMLPKSTDINKQITYGEYVAEQEKFRKMHGDNYAVYNAFLMPFDSDSDTWSGEGPMKNIGYATGNWKSNIKSYEKVHGILVDLKYLMKLSVSQDENEILKLANEIMKYSGDDDYE